MAKREFWGLDLETSGTSHERHVPIQLGLTAPNLETASWYINGWHWSEDCTYADHPVEACEPGVDSWLWDQRAFEVHGITKEKLEAEGQSIYEVTVEAIKFIEEHSEVWHGQRKLVGWNVGSFDVPFVRRHLPGVARVLSYQSADLNAITFAIAEAQGTSYSQLQYDAKTYAFDKAAHAEGVTKAWHDAGFDALCSLHAFNYLQERIRNGY